MPIWKLPFLLGLANEEMFTMWNFLIGKMKDADEIDHLQNCPDAVAITSHKRKKGCHCRQTQKGKGGKWQQPMK